MRKSAKVLFAALVCLFPFATAEAQEPEYRDLTKSESFYRVTKAFTSPIYELDGNPDTKISFVKARSLTDMDYLFLDILSVKTITFKTETPQYQRILLMNKGQIRQQFDLSKYPDGTIHLPSEILLDQIKIQFNGGEGTLHILNSVGIIGRTIEPIERTKPTGNVLFVSPPPIEELPPEEEKENDIDEGDGTPLPPVEPPIDEEKNSDTDPGDGEYAESEPIEEEERGENDATPSPGELLDPPVIEEEDDGRVGEGVPPNELPQNEKEEEPKGEQGIDFIDNGRGEPVQLSEPEPLKPVVVPAIPIIKKEVTRSFVIEEVQEEKELLPIEDAEVLPFIQIDDEDVSTAEIGMCHYGPNCQPIEDEENESSYFHIEKARLEEAFGETT